MWKTSTLRVIFVSLTFLFILSGVLFYLVLGVRNNANHIARVQTVSACWDKVLDEAVLISPATHPGEHQKLINEAILCTKIGQVAKVPPSTLPPGTTLPATLPPGTSVP